MGLRRERRTGDILGSSIYRNSLKTLVRVKSSQENVYTMRRRGDLELNCGQHTEFEGREKHRKECDQVGRGKSGERQLETLRKQ